LSELVEAHSPFEDAPAWNKVAGVFRRVCLLRAEGRVAEARALEAAEFGPAFADARASDPAPERAVSDFLAGEKRRVGDAIAFAEVVVPLLAARTDAPDPAAAPPLRVRRSAGGPPADLGIADMIDDMLSQERSGRR
jgi:hypothetical protein